MYDVNLLMGNKPIVCWWWLRKNRWRLAKCRRCRQPAAKCVASARKLAQTVCGKTSVYRQHLVTIIYSPTSWSAPVPLSTTASVHNSNICCSQMGFLPTSQMCSAYKYRSCVLQHLSEIGQKPIFQCEDRNTKVKSGQNHENKMQGYESQ